MEYTVTEEIQRMAGKLTPARYMTPIGKSLAMAHWAKAQEESVKPVGDPGGHGYVDCEVIDFCEAINAMDYVCTLQSCAGHQLESFDDPGTFYIEPANLWLWFTEAAARRFYTVAGDFERSPWVDSVRILFIDGREIADIVFSPWQLQEDTKASMLNFLEKLGKAFK